MILITLMEEGVKAKLALEADACTEAVEKVIEAKYTAVRELALKVVVLQEHMRFTMV